MSLSRRFFLAAGASAAGASLYGCSSLALSPAAPVVSTLAPGVARVRFGNATITSLPDGFVDRPLVEGFVRNATLPQVQAALKDAGLPTDKVTVPFTPFLVQVGGRNVIFDGGNGTFGAPTSGRMLDSLKATGVQPSQIDTVILSHFHGDHLQGLRNKAGELVYPNAEIMVPEAEWAFWMDDARMGAAPDAMKGAFQGVRRVLAPSAKDVKQFKWGQEIVPGITTVDASGHTPGHTAFVIASGNAKMMYVADITNTPVLFATNPEWKVMFDMDADKAVATRKRILDMAAADKIRLSFYHASFPATGFIAKEGAGYRFVAAPWS